MKLSSRLRNHQWKSSSLSPGDHGWEYDEDPLKAAELLDECERALQDVLSLADNFRGGERDVEAAFMRARAVSAKLRERPIVSDVTPYFVLDGNRRRALPFDIDAAIDIVREEFIAGHSHGTLCAKDASANDVVPVLHAHGEKQWPAFETQAREWLARVVDLALKNAEQARP